MKGVTTILLAVMIFGPSITVRDKNGQVRVSYEGIVYGAVQFIYWIIDKITKQRTSE